MVPINNDELAERKKKIKKAREEYWNNMLPFKTIEDIPSLPVVTKDEWNNFYIPHLIRCGAIPKNELIKGYTYTGTCRNADKAVWNGEKFVYKRTKFNMTFDESINHFEDDDGYDLFVPLTKI